METRRFFGMKRGGFRLLMLKNLGNFSNILSGPEFITRLKKGKR